MTRKYLPRVMLLLIGVQSGVLLEARVFGPLRGQTADRVSTFDKSSSPGDSLPAVTVSSAGENGRTPPPRRETSAVVVGVPKVVVEEETFDFGTVRQGAHISHVFSLRNTGDAPLVIEKVRTTCGCTFAKITTKRVEVGQKTELTVNFNTRGRLGPQDRAIIVETNDPNTPKIRLAMVGTLTSPIVKEPSSLTLGRILSEDDQSKGYVNVRATDGFQFRVTGIRTSHKGVVAEVQQIEPGTHYRVLIALKPSLPAGPFAGWVRLVTDDVGQYREIPIIVRARIGPGGPIATGDKPVIAGPLVDGGSIDLASMRGNPTIVVFWASWCGYCRREIPKLVDLYEKHHQRGLRIIGVNTDSNTAKARKACDQWNVPWPNIHFVSDGSSGYKNPLSKKYEIRGIPAVYLIDREGKVLTTRLRGAALEKLVENVLDGKALANRKR